MTVRDMKTFIAVSIAAHALVLMAASMRLPGLYWRSGNNGPVQIVSLVDGGAAGYSGGRARPSTTAIKLRKEAAASVKTDDKRIEADVAATMEEAGEGAGVAAGEGVGEAASGSGGHLASFRDMVRGRIEAAKFYPLFARQRGYEGVVGVRFSVDTDGSVKDVVVISPCHCDALNKAACEAVKRAAPLPAPPEMVTMEVDLSYRLE